MFFSPSRPPLGEAKLWLHSSPFAFESLLLARSFCKARCALWPCRTSQSLRNSFFEATAPLCPELSKNSLTLVFALIRVKSAFLQLACEPQNALWAQVSCAASCKPALRVLAEARKLRLAALHCAARFALRLRLSFSLVEPLASLPCSPCSADRLRRSLWPTFTPNSPVGY